ncbi:M56 family metallopeptidase [Nonomuraea rubra]
MITSLVRQRRWIALAVTVAAVAGHVLMAAGLIPCPGGPPLWCLAASAAVVVAASVVAIGVRATELAARTSWAVRRLARVPASPALRAAARRTGVRRVVCLAGEDRTAFCSGLLRPRVYVTQGLDGPVLDAVLLHESAHARRRDPLRRLLARAVGDVLFFLPLAAWWAERQAERSEVAADRFAIARCGRKAVAAALVSLGAAPAVAGTPGFGGAAQARLAQLLGDPLPRRRPSRARTLASLGGLLSAVALMMCLGQTLLAAVL